jgi:hypothetical protein
MTRPITSSPKVCTIGNDCCGFANSKPSAVLPARSDDSSSVHVLATNQQHGHADPALRVTPAMECGLTDHVWSIQELLTVPTELESAA